MTKRINKNSKRINVISPPWQLSAPTHTKTVFLAGSISNAEDWQSQAIRKFMLYDEYLTSFDDEYWTIYNPRRIHFDVNKKGVELEQITWEYEALKLANYIIFWFSHETLAPITLFEYGKHLVGNKKLFVGCHPEYKRRRDVIIQTRLANPLIEVYHDLQTVVDKCIQEIHRI